jgi:hypothetical protein
MGSGDFCWPAPGHDLPPAPAAIRLLKALFMAISWADRCPGRAAHAKDEQSRSHNKDLNFEYINYMM